MNRAAIQKSLGDVEAEIIGRKKHARRKYGGAGSTPWPEAVVRQLGTLKAQAKQYRAMLTEDHDEEAEPEGRCSTRDERG